MSIKIFGQEIPLAVSYCQLNGKQDNTPKPPGVNLYVRMTNFCQASCRFCIWKNNARECVFNEDRFYFMLSHISKTVQINKVSFTGGEPTIFNPVLNRCLKMTKELVPDAFTVVSTNGYGINDVEEKYVDSFAVSRHGITWEDNVRIFDTEQIPRTEWFEQCTFKDKVHITCNLMKGDIDTPEKAYQFINHYGNMGFSDFGFVTLMPVNDFTRSHRIRISNGQNSIDLSKMPNTITPLRWTQGNQCACNNYIVRTTSGDLVRVYARETIDSNRCEGILVYDVDRLRIGFNGEVLYGE